MLLREIIDLGDKTLEFNPNELEAACSHLLTNKTVLKRFGDYELCQTEDYVFLTKSSIVCGWTKIIDFTLQTIYWLPKFRNGSSLPIFIQALRDHLNHPITIAANNPVFKDGRGLLQALLARKAQFSLKKQTRDGQTSELLSVDDLGRRDSIVIEDSVPVIFPAHLPGSGAQVFIDLWA